jgi:hypothetical protein
LARFVSVDPLQFDYPQLCSYQYAGNKPINSIDIEGKQGENDVPIGKTPHLYRLNYPEGSVEVKDGKIKNLNNISDINYYHVNSGSLNRTRPKSGERVKVFSEEAVSGLQGMYRVGHSMSVNVGQGFMKTQIDTIVNTDTIPGVDAIHVPETQFPVDSIYTNIWGRNVTIDSLTRVPRSIATLSQAEVDSRTIGRSQSLVNIMNNRAATDSTMTVVPDSITITFPMSLPFQNNVGNNVQATLGVPVNVTNDTTQPNSDIISRLYFTQIINKPSTPGFTIPESEPIIFNDTIYLKSEIFVPPFEIIQENP